MTNPPTQTRTDFLLRWIWGTTIGWILALLSWLPTFGIWELITQVNWQYSRDQVWYQRLADGVWDAVFLLLAGITLVLMGMSIGLAQWRVALRGFVNKRTWIVSSLFSTFAGVAGLILVANTSPPTLFSANEGNYSGLDTTLILNNTWFTTVVIFGVFLGIITGLPQWFMLRRHFDKAYNWIFMVVVGSIAVFVTLAASIFVVKNAVMSWTLACCASPIVFGIVTGTGLYNLLNRNKNVSV